MILEFSDWLFLVDVEENQTYSNQEAQEHCTCAFCRNFYRTVDLAYPNLRYFLRKFGINIEAPDSLLPVTPELYQAVYPVTGKILRHGAEPIFLGDLPITVEQDNGGEGDIFLLNTGLMNLPWVMDEEPADSVNTATMEDFFGSYKLL